MYKESWYILIIIVIILLIVGVFSTITKAEDDYSNDFEFQMEQEYDSPPAIPSGVNIEIDRSTYATDRVFKIIEQQKERKIRDEIYRRLKYPNSYYKEKKNSDD